MAVLEGIVPNLPDHEYHAHKALSSTGARLLLDSPARFHYAQSHPQEPRDVFDVGSAVHSKVLGVGAAITVLDHPDWRSKLAQAQREQSRENGHIPILRKQASEIDAIAEAVLSHPTARLLFEQAGTPEASVFTTDPQTGVNVRARFDYLPDLDVDDPWTVDLKTALDASPDGFAKSVASYRYDIQQEFYLGAYATVTGDFMARMKFVACEKVPPYLVGVYQLSSEFAEMGRAKVRQALEVYAACSAADIWPGYPVDADPLQPPTWLMFQEGVIA